MCKNTSTLVYRGISLAWYIPWYTCLYRGILMILFLATVYCTKNVNLQSIETVEVETASNGVLQLYTIEFHLQTVRQWMR